MRIAPHLSRTPIRPRLAAITVVRLRAGALLAAATLLAGCGGGTPPTAFDLTAPRSVARAAPARGQIVVAEPIALQAFDAERIIVKDPSGAVSFLGGGQWVDRLPRLVQTRLIQTFENGARIGAVSRPGDRTVADYQLNTEIRAFEIAAASGEAVVEMSAKLVHDRTGRVVTARLFSSRVPVGSMDAASAAQALDRALSTVLVDVVGWIGAGR
jgi:cholesterol transport system auxiliary component